MCLCLPLPPLQVPVPDTVTSLTWAGNSLLCAAPDGYYVLRPLLPHQHSMAQHGGGGGLSSPTAGAGTAGGMQWQLCLLADHLVSTRTLLGCIPDLGLGLMAWEDNMVLVTDAAGGFVGLGVCLYVWWAGGNGGQDCVC